MKALTIHPVWAWAIVHGHKRVENRTWRTHHRGPLLIHASADSPAARQSDAAARKALATLGIDVPEMVPAGAIVGQVELIDVVTPNSGQHDLFNSRLDGDPLAVGPFCWLLGQPTTLTPIALRGQQGLFNYVP